jgi:hypothetical protein
MAVVSFMIHAAVINVTELFFSFSKNNKGVSSLQAVSEVLGMFDIREQGRDTVRPILKMKISG